MKSIEILKAIPQPLKKKRVAAYARVSTDSERMCHSLSAQVSYYNDYIQKNPNWIFCGVYSDEGVTGTSLDRPGFKKLMEECEKGNIDVVLTKSISRFGRNVVALLETVRKLKEKGIEVRFEREHINSISASGELMMTLLAAFAEMESHSISENTIWSLRHNFEQGIEKSSRGPLGFKRDAERNLVVDEEEAKIVRKIFQLYLEGNSPHEISDYMGIPYSTIWYILRHQKYKGDEILQQTMSTFEVTHRANTRKRNRGELPKYFIADACPAIMSHEIFNAVQKEIERRRIPKYNPFTSIITCSKCGRHYRRVCNRPTLYYWKCSTKIEKGTMTCPAPNIPEKQLYSATADILEDIKEITVEGNKLICRLKDGKNEERYYNSGNKQSNQQDSSR